MATIDTSKIRNVALLGHSGSGKTSLTEAMLFTTGGTDRLGKIVDGNTVCDYDPEEIARKISLSTSIAPISYRDYKINVLDAPGELDFVGEQLQVEKVAGCAVIVVDAKAGVKVGTQLAWEQSKAAGLPIAFFINKCDDPDANFSAVFADLHEKFGTAVCPVSLPVINGSDFKLINLIDMNAYAYDAKGKRSVIELDDAMKNIAAEYTDSLNEALAGTSEELMEKYFAEEEITKEEKVKAIHDGSLDGSIVPVYCGAATNLWGVMALMDAMIDSFPNPATGKLTDAEGKKVAVNVNGDPSIFVFKTVADPFVGKMSFFKVMQGKVTRDMALRNATTDAVEKLAHIYVVKGKKQTEVDELCCGDIGMVAKLVNTNTNDTLYANTPVKYSKIVYPTPYLTQAIIPASAADESKISQSIAKMLEEDLTLKYENNSETKQMLISGQGDIHLAVLVAKMKARFGVNVKYDTPAIPYKEKITKTVDIHGRHKKQNGGSGQFGDVWIKFSPGEGEGLQFSVSVVGGVVPKNFNPAVEKGLLEAMAKGAAGYPMMCLAADLHDGSYHPIDSDEISFKTAAQLAYKECLEKAGPVLLEPVGNLDITIPDSLVGDVMGDLNTRRGTVMGMDPVPDKSGYTTVHATIPKSETVKYPITLRAMTKGLGSMEFEVTGYDVVPAAIAQKVVDEYKKSQA